MVDVDQDLAGIVSILTLGAGLLALFAGVENFWMIFVIGWVVLTPLAGMLSGDDEDETEVHGPERTTTTAGTDQDSTTDALETLRDRYARGELTEEQFERKVDRLLRTETPEDARDRLGGGAVDDAETDAIDDAGPDRERKREGDRDRERER